MSKFKIGDIVYVSNPDLEYEAEYGHRFHNAFFGKVIEVEEYPTQTVVTVDFNDGYDWAYNEEELEFASTLKDMTLEEFSNTFGVVVNGTIRRD